MLLFLILFNTLLKVPVNGVCWYIDELLYPLYHKINIDEPVFMITASHTGSTQLCHYLENDTKNFISPTVAETALPYLWVWKLTVLVANSLGLKQEQMLSFTLFGKEALKRHEFVLNKSDTWDGLIRSWHFGVLSSYLGCSFMKWGLSPVKTNEPFDYEFWKSHEQFTHCILKKVIYCCGNPNQRMIIKGHFLTIAKVLEKQYPKAKIFVVVRHPQFD